ncbi:hypothetical protein QF026_007548 [Streptomyces aurantiacus]|nr:hypothetical protein [Streptomyces aurantiacus]
MDRRRQAGGLGARFSRHGERESADQGELVRGHLRGADFAVSWSKRPAVRVRFLSADVGHDRDGAAGVVQEPVRDPSQMGSEVLRTAAADHQQTRFVGSGEQHPGGRALGGAPTQLHIRRGVCEGGLQLPHPPFLVQTLGLARDQWVVGRLARGAAPNPYSCQWDLTPSRLLIAAPDQGVSRRWWRANSSESVTRVATPVTTTLQPVRVVGSMSSASYTTTERSGRDSSAERGVAAITFGRSLKVRNCRGQLYETEAQPTTNFC